MQEELISFDIAKLAKEKGFTLGTVGSHVYNYYQDDGNTGCISWGHLYLDSPAKVPLSLLQKWLRETHNILVDVVAYYDENQLPLTKSNLQKPKGYFVWNYYDESFNEEEAQKFENYDLALEHGLKQGLNLIN